MIVRRPGDVAMPTPLPNTGSHAKALAGIAQARELGFTVKVAATMHKDEVDFAPGLNAFLDSLDIDEERRLIRPVAQQGFAQNGQTVTLDTLAPEPTMAVDRIWWHPVAVTDPRMQVTTSPRPLHAAFDIIRDTVATQDAAMREGRRRVFRCARNPIAAAQPSHLGSPVRSVLVQDSCRRLRADLCG